MRNRIVSLAAGVLAAGWLACPVWGQETARDGAGLPARVAEVMGKYKAQDPNGHAELMKLRRTDPQAFRDRVGALLRDGAGRRGDRAADAAATPPAPSVPETVKVERDIAYAAYGERKVLLDLYLPKQPPAGKLPCVVVIHGGGWSSGDKGRFARFASAFAEKGFAAACIGYRLRPEVEVRQCVEDAKAAVRWVRANAERYGIDPERIGAFGGSAGAHLAAILGTSFKAKQLEGPGGNEGVSSRVRAVVGMATPADLTAFARVTSTHVEAAKLISPAAYVDSDSAVFLLIHAEGDRTVPYEQSKLLVGKLTEAKVPARLITVEGGSHAFWNGTGPAAAQALADALTFFEQTLRENDRKAK